MLRPIIDTVYCETSFDTTNHLLTAQLQDVCKITIFYSDKMVARVTRERNNNAVKFQVSETLCLAINNIDYVLQYIQPFVQVNMD